MDREGQKSRPTSCDSYLLFLIHYRLSSHQTTNYVKCACRATDEIWPETCMPGELLASCCLEPCSISKPFGCDYRIDYGARFSLE